MKDTSTWEEYPDMVDINKKGCYDNNYNKLYFLSNCEGLKRYFNKKNHLIACLLCLQ